MLWQDILNRLGRWFSIGLRREDTIRLQSLCLAEFQCSKFAEKEASDCYKRRPVKPLWPIRAVLWFGIRKTGESARTTIFHAGRANLRLALFVAGQIESVVVTLV